LEIPAHPRRADRTGGTVAPPAAWKILREAGIEPAPGRAGHGWRTLLAGQAKTILAADFFHAGTVFLRRLHVSSFTGHGTGACTWPASSPIQV